MGLSNVVYLLMVETVIISATKLSCRLMISNDLKIVYNYLEGLFKEIVVASFEVTFHLLRRRSMSTDTRTRNELCNSHI